MMTESPYWDDEFYVHVHTTNRDLTGECGVEDRICRSMQEALKMDLVFSRGQFVLGLKIEGGGVAFNYCPFCGGDFSKITTYLKPPKGTNVIKVVDE